jgi:UDPglucose 6-dehydrogenase
VTRIAIIGSGYVGLTTGVCFAHLGHDVTCADIDEDKVASLNRGEVPILERGLDRLLADGLRRERLRFVVGAASAVAGAEFVLLCVPTPQGQDGAADLSFIHAACREIRPLLTPGCIVITKSTVPIGSALAVAEMLDRDDVSVASNPEFLREGHAVHDFLHPARIVVGSDDRSVAIKVASLYIGVTAPVIMTDTSSAETIKYVANVFLATKLSFINEVAGLCDKVGANVSDVVLGVGYDDRIGHAFLAPGPGWGGSCLPKDTRALLRTADEVGFDFSLLRGVIAANDEQQTRVVEKIRASAGGDVRGRRIAALGLTFKAETDDLRDSPALGILNRLRAEGAEIVAYDPTVRSPIDGMETVLDPYSACDQAAVLVVLTEWDEFRWLDMEKVASMMDGDAVVDARNMLDPTEVRRHGLVYQGIGR